MSTVNSKDKVGLAVLVVVLLGGMWVAAAPFIVGYQPRSPHWAMGTTNEFAVGLGLVTVAFAGLLVFAANALRALSRTRQVDEAQQGGLGSPAGDAASPVTTPGR